MAGGLKTRGKPKALVSRGAAKLLAAEVRRMLDELKALPAPDERQRNTIAILEYETERRKQCAKATYVRRKGERRTSMGEAACTP